MMKDTSMRELVDRLNELRNAYYQNDAPIVSDSEYDELYDKLVALERETGTVLADSPSLRVGSEPLTKFEQHKHIKRLWSLDKVRTESDLREWSARAERLIGEYNATHADKLPAPTYSLEYKFDGLTVNLTYKDGKLVQAATRGNGVTGEAILNQIRTVRTIPLTIPYKGTMECQGEGIIRLSVLDKLNGSGEERLKNARNAAAGALRNLDPRVTAKRKLDCFFYSLGYIEGREFSSHSEAIEFLREQGIPVSGFMKLCSSIDEVYCGILEAEKKRDSLDFLIDGMVVKLCDLRTREALGETERFPRWAIAYKFAAEETTTTVLDVTWEVGRTGKLTPRAHLEPVDLAGATISHATLNNYDDILRKRVGIGSRVFIRRSNDVIPEILGAVENDSPEREIAPPERCPACGAHVEKRGAHIFCTNTLTCPPQIVASLAHYASRDAMDIDGFSEKTAALLVESVGLTSIPDLYDIAKDSFKRLTDAEVKGFGEKKIANLVFAIEKSKKCTLGAFLYAIGVPNVGAKTARDIARAFSTLENVRKADIESLMKIPDVGAVVAESVTDFFSDERIANAIDRLLEHGVEPAAEAVKNSDSPISGMTIVVTGTMERMGRSEIEALIESFGAKAASSVSKKTSLVVAGLGAGSKLDKARELGIRVTDENGLFDMIKEQYADR